MEKQLSNGEIVNNNEIVSLDQARFLDRLEPEYEQEWNKLVESAAEMKLTLKEFAVPLWQDGSFPAVIRDRAMLLYIGKESIGTWKGPPSIHPFFQIAGAGHEQAMDMDDVDGSDFREWLDEALTYGDIIQDTTLYRLSYKYFTNGNWDQERFEQTLEKFDPNKVQWTWQGLFDEYAGLPVLPYIDDIFNGTSVDRSNEKMQQWAKEKYDLYVQNFIINEEALPSWLQNLPQAVIKNIVQREYEKVENDEMLPLSIIAAYENYSIGFYDGYRFEQYDLARNGSSILKHLGEFSQRAIRTYLQARYRDAVCFRGTLTREDEDTILSYSTAPLSDGLADLVDRMDKIRAEESEARAERLAQEKENRKKREAERVIDEQRRKADEVRLNNAKVAFLHARGIFTNSNEDAG